MTIHHTTADTAPLNGQSSVLGIASPAQSRMDRTFKAKWLAALRNGYYQQCTGALQRDDGYCCIGVAAVVAGYGIDALHDRVIRTGASRDDMKGYCALDDFGLRDRSRVIEMNDRGASFAEIADYIEANL